MAAFPARDRESFLEYWDGIRTNESNILKTISDYGPFAGNIGCFVMDDRREAGYWIGRQFRGRGIATKALEQLPGLVLVRPLYGVVARHNIGSQRVQEKFGIIRSREAAEDVTFILA